MAQKTGELTSVAISAYLLVQVWKFNGDVYLSAIFWLIWGILNSVKEIIVLPKNDPDYDNLLIISFCYILLLVVTIIVMAVIRENVFGYYNWFKPAHDHNNRVVFQQEQTCT